MTVAESHVILSVNLVTLFTMNGSSIMKMKMEIIALTENCLTTSKHYNYEYYPLRKLRCLLNLRQLS